MNFKKFILILTCLITASAAFAQNIRVTGQVKDAQSGEPVSFVTVSQQGTGNAVSADADGRYAINVPANASLRFSSVGYDEVIVEVDAGIAAFMWMGLSDGKDRAVPTWTMPLTKDAILKPYLP